MILNQFKRVMLNLLLVLLVYQAIRLCFYLVNHSFFQLNGVGEYFYLVWNSLRFDLSVLFIINSIYVVFGLLPFQFIHNKRYQSILNFWFLLSNVLAILFDIADIAYFPFQRKRMSSEVFNLIGRKSDFIDLLPSYIIQFWYVPFFIIGFVWLLIFLNKKINKISLCNNNQLINLFFIFKIITSWLLAFLAIRGGFQLKPILTFNALSVTSNDKVALVYNTPFSILHTLQEQQVPEINFYSEQEMDKFIRPYHVPIRNTSVKNCNIVLIVLESFGKSYTGISGRKSYTPFLDSIMANGLTFTNAFANANISATGIPAIIAGIPAFMEEPFATSPYGQNSIDALPKLLNKIGYSSSFYHGGTNGTMSFDLFAKNAGYDTYFGRNEYANDNDYDGSWGIWDEPYLQYVANELDKKSKPFFSTVFTLSSHEPFHLPTQYKQSELAKLNSIQRGVSYTDLALRHFFETASKKAWFANTLFVITPDHNYIACHDEQGYYNTGFGLYAIPVVFYKPNDTMLKGIDSNAFQQINIMPTVLDYINYPNRYFTFGRSAFDTLSIPFVFNYANNYNQFLFNEYLVTANDTNLNGIFYFKQDSLLKQNLLPNDSLKSALFPRFKAYKQFLNNSIRGNKQTAN
jgi:phosphoglycerol transferase MdoB-like AlkP superfamily enzyme